MSDQSIRDLALQPDRSFIVQAPAGSGKTSLLVKRFLKLLSLVNQPEQVVALTFTRKAAEEMQTRILQTLRKDSEDPVVRTILEQDRRFNWSLLTNRRLLKVKTLDGFIRNLVNLHGTGLEKDYRLLETYEVALVFQEVVRHCLIELQREGLVDKLWIHLDNRIDWLEGLLVRLLIKREQWVYHLIVPDTKMATESLEKELLAVRKELLEEAQRLFEPYFTDFQRCLKNLGKLKEDLPSWMLAFIHYPELKLASFEEMLALAEFWLTKEFTFRRSWSKRQGVELSNSLAHNRIAKDELRQLKEDLSTFAFSEALRLSWVALLRGPGIKYSDYQKEILDELLKLLPQLLAHLTLCFTERRVLDYTELTLRALALLEGERREEILAYYSANLTHLLIDEFQDTSFLHYRLINHLVESFHFEPTKTLFIVGDPLQSIYRFRDAEVGLFLRAQRGDLLPVTVLYLSCNFRTAPELVAWFNQLFPKLFPQVAAINLGAIPYVEAVSTRSPDPLAVHRVVLLKQGGIEKEALAVVRRIQEIRREDPAGEITILVKAKIHAANLILALAQEKIPYQGEELLNLKDYSWIEDLLILTRCLSDFTDQIGWVALLRSWWCGLSFEDLTKIDWELTEDCWSLLQQGWPLSEDGTKRLTFLVEALRPIMVRIGKDSWSQLIYQAWINLQGERVDHQQLETFLTYLPVGNLDLGLLEKKLSQNYLELTANTKGVVRIMTIHKAKGLEFTHIIVPGMNRTVRSDELPLLNWWERLPEAETSHLLMGVFDPQDPSEPTYNYLRMVEQLKNSYEQGRLLYVALTRAISSVTLIGSGERINSGSFFSIMQPAWESTWEDEGSPETYQLTLNRSIPQRRVTLPAMGNCEVITPREVVEWAWEDSIPLGLVVHQLLEYLADQPAYETVLAGYSDRLIREMLRKYGVIDLEQGVTKVWQMFQHLRGSTIFQWILRPRVLAYNEHKILSGEDPNKLLVIDRVFYDEKCWWIIDYKTAVPYFNEPLEQFLRRAVASYRTQLLGYAQAWKLQRGGEVRMGLFFPLIAVWQEVT